MNKLKTLMVALFVMASVVISSQSEAQVYPMSFICRSTNGLFWVALNIAEPVGTPCTLFLPYVGYLPGFYSLE